MNRKIAIRIGCMLAAMALGWSSASAAAKAAKAGPETSLTVGGEKLQARYAEMLAALQTEIVKALPKIDEQKKAAYLKARENEKAAEAEVTKRQGALDACRGAAGLLEHRKNWVSKATAAVAAAEKLKQASTDDARKAAQAALEKEQKNKALGEAELKKSLDAVEKARTEEPKLAEDLKAAQAALAKAQADTLKTVDELNLNALLTSDKLDAKLVQYVVLSQATPQGLAEFAQQGAEQAALVEKLLADDVLMVQLVSAEGAREGKVGQAMQIYTAIQKASPTAKEGVLQRLALAVSLEHAVPIAQSNPSAYTNAPAVVDPVKRYLHFEKAFLAGELDPAFKELTVWDYRNVVNGDETNEALAWGREMLRNYRPDHISTPDRRWRYVEAVRTDVKYGSGDNKYDLPTQHFYQNIIMNGGVCGRRAFFGRFILRCFGIPTLPRPQPGHATLVHWSPEGWVINLGASWGHGSVEGKPDLDFLAMTQARKVEKAYPQVQRAKWVGDVLGETRAYGFRSGVSGLWNAVALYRQQAIIEEAKAVALAAVGTDIGEANESKVKEIVKTVTLSAEDKQIIVGQDGVITIPAVACSTPTNSTEKIRFMKSYLGGMQLHYNRLAQPETFEYTFEAPAAGKYAISARVVTVSPGQILLVAANAAQAPVEIAVPFTVGMWDNTPPVEVALVKGKNVLHFSRGGANIRGLTLKDFTLTPVK
jgi:hypothetical protein